MQLMALAVALLLTVTGIPLAIGSGPDGPVPAGWDPDVPGATRGGNVPHGEEFSPWLSHREVVPMRKVTLVGHDRDGLHDDYIYMAAVPASVFQHRGKLYSNPLLFYEPEHRAVSNADRTMNSYQGLEYFMRDWMTVMGEADHQVELINVPPDDPLLPQGSGTTVRTGTDIYRMSAELALANWEYSDVAVVAVVDEYPERTETTSGIVGGTIPGLPLEEKEFFGTKSVGIEPIYHNFTVDEGYGFIYARMEWGIEWTAGTEERGKDLDMQLYDWQLGQVAASLNWNVIGTPGVRPHEEAASVIYNTGPWGVAVTYMPTESLEEGGGDEAGTEGNGTEAGTGGNGTVSKDGAGASDRSEDENGEVKGTPSPGSGEGPMATWDSDADYEITVTSYPGTTVTIPDRTFFMTRNAQFRLTWSGGSELTLMIREPSGAEIARTTGTSPLTLNIDQLGEGDHTAMVARMGEQSVEVEFELAYSWRAFKDRREGESLASAANGAVRASLLNAPLLYVKENGIPKEVREALNKLGVREIELVDFGDRFGKDMGEIRNLLQRPLRKVTHFTDEQAFYRRIAEQTGRNHMVMTTMDPWTFWHSEVGPVGEYDGARFVGPAAYAAAHHGAPVIIMELDPATSNPQAWHNRFWLEAYTNRKTPSVGCMVLTGHQFYDFLGEIGLDRAPIPKGEKGEEDMEVILTVADQFDIGMAWDRSLVGKAHAGRILGSPVDTSYWIGRSVFYPLMIHANPAVNPELDTHGGMRTTGSVSYFPGVPHLYQMVIEPEREIRTEVPNLYTWVSQRHRFNERAGRDGYWGCDYTAASGITPYRTPSNNPIDRGNSRYRDDPGAMYWPDMTISEVVPFYGEKAGYTSVHSTGWSRVAGNLNRGVVMWITGAHGSNSGGGRIGFWNEDNHDDPNPWRAYEDGGCTEEVEGINTIDGLPWAAGPDTVRSDKYTGLDYQIGYDGLVTAILQQHHTASVDGYRFDDEIDNLYSAGISSSSCLIANTYLHLAMIRHGSVFQIIDPWLTSWYAHFAIQTFMRDIALGLTVGEAYSNGIHHVGIGYLTGQWWWDIYENIVYYGDPALRVYSPAFSWPEPDTVSVAGLSLSGHTPGGARDHPNAISLNYGFLVAGVAGVLMAVVAVVWGMKREGEDGGGNGMDEEHYGLEPDDDGDSEPGWVEGETPDVEWE